MTKNTCYFSLDRVWNIHAETTENSISRFLDFNIFSGSKKPLEARSISRCGPSAVKKYSYQYEHPFSTPATRLLKKSNIIKKAFGNLFN